MSRMLPSWWVSALAVASAMSSPSAHTAEQGLSLQQIATTQAVTGVAISPNGESIAYTLSVPRVPGKGKDGPNFSQLHVLDAAGQSRPFVSGEVNIASPTWLDNGNIAFLMKGDKDETRSLYRIPADGGGATLWKSLKTNINRFDVSPDGKQLALIGIEEENAEAKALRDRGFDARVVEEGERRLRLWLSSSEDNAAPKAVDIEGSVQSAQWSPAGDRLALVVAPNERVDDTLVLAKVTILSTDGRVISVIDNPGKLGQLAWSTDGEHLAIISAEDASDPSEGRLTVVSKNGGKQRDLLPGLLGHIWNIEWRDADTLVFISNEGTATRLGEVDLDGSQRTLLNQSTPVFSSFSQAANGRLALVGSTPSSPSEVYRFDSGSTAAMQMTQSNPWLKEVALATQEVIRYTSRDGVEIEGILVHPLNRKKGERVPLIMFIHGGPEAHISNGWVTNYSVPAQYAAAQGFASFLPNYRASTGRGVAYSKLNHGRPAKEEFDDLIDAIDHLVAIGLVDTKKVGITGGSYGGYATAWGTTYYSDRYAAAAMFVAITDKIGLIGTSDIPNEFYRVHYQAWPWENWAMYTEASPIYYVTRNKTPTLILHGDADPRVDPTQGRTMYRYLKQGGNAPVRLVMYPGEGHGNARAASRWDYSLRVMQWMTHYLKGPGGEPPAYEMDYQLDSFK